MYKTLLSALRDEIPPAHQLLYSRILQASSRAEVNAQITKTYKTESAKDQSRVRMECWTGTLSTNAHFQLMEPERLHRGDGL